MIINIFLALTALAIVAFSAIYIVPSVIKLLSIPPENVQLVNMALNLGVFIISIGGGYWALIYFGVELDTLNDSMVTTDTEIVAVTSTITPITILTPTPTFSVTPISTTPIAQVQTGGDTLPSTPPTSTPTSTPTPEPIFPVSRNNTFEDGFSREINSEYWNIIQGDGQAQIDSGKLLLSSNGQNFPLVYPKDNPFPEAGNFRINLDISYPTVTARGVGFRLGDSLARYGANQDIDRNELYQGRIVEIWQDVNSWHISVGDDDQRVFTLSAPNRDEHEIEINYVNQVYQILVDGNEVYRTEPTDRYPNIIWFGNPAQVDSSGAWSSLAINSISIEMLSNQAELIPPTPTPVPIASGRVLFVTDHWGSSEIALFNIRTENVTQLSFNPAYDWGPAISPNGSQVVYVSNFTGQAEIFVMPTNGGAANQLTFEGAADDHPAWTPDGRIVFASERTGNWDIYLMNSDGGNVQNFTSHGARDIYPAVSPNGQKIAFISDREGVQGLYIMNIDGSSVTPLVTTVPKAWAPAWSPDGRRILFVSIENDEHLQGSIYSVNADGTGVQPFISNPSEEVGYPSWSPDGNYVAFSRLGSNGKGSLYLASPDGTILNNLLTLRGSSVWGASWGY